jgi:peroxiredoxin
LLGSGANLEPLIPLDPRQPSDAAAGSAKFVCSLLMSLLRRLLSKFRSLYIAPLLMSAMLAACDRSGERGLNPGDLAPDFKLPNTTGSEQTLADFKDKVVLLNFWATWCEPCVSEMPAMQRLYLKLKDRGFAVVAIATDDTVDAIREFQKNYSLDFPILIDQKGTLKTRYKVTGVPESFLLDRQGRMVMVLDPETNQPSVRIVGPRDWDSPRLMAMIGQKLDAK